VTDETSAAGATATDETATLQVLDSLYRALQPRSVLVLAVDGRVMGQAEALAGHYEVVACNTEALPERVAATAADVILLCGWSTWHAVRALGSGLGSRAARGLPFPVIIVEGVPRRATNEGADERNAAIRLQDETRKAGVRSALTDLAQQRAPDATLVACAPGRGAWALLPSASASSLRSWLDERRATLDALDRAHRERVLYFRRYRRGLDVLADSQRSAIALVHSGRFRLGTRLVRVARRLTRKPAFFSAPSRVLRRQTMVDQMHADASARSVPARVSERPPRLRVTYVVPELRRSGGTLVVSQLAAELELLDVQATVATLRVRGDVRHAGTGSRVLAFPSAEALAVGVPRSDIAVATHWSTAGLVKDLVDRGRADNGAYLIQDYEAWFYPESDVTTRARVMATYELLPNRIVTSAWLGGLLEADGHGATKISPGIDLAFFYPRVTPTTQPMVLAMARPRTPRRGYETLVAALARVHESVPDAHIVLFGEQIRGANLPFPYRCVGVVSDPERLARLYSRARVFVDASDFQAFGRSALEAMACGAVPVMTDVGGVGEYAVDGVNTLLAPVRSSAAIADAVVRVLSETALHERLREGGLETVRGHSAKREARATLAYFEGIAAREPEADRSLPQPAQPAD
jgi:glycosyltransferase involved in cell wall biosynthesis